MSVETATETANPNFRDLLAPYTEWASETLHEKFPNLEADHLSALGPVLVGLGAAAAISSAPPIRIELKYLLV